MGLVLIILYIGVFQLAFKVTEKIEILKELMEVQFASLGDLKEQKKWGRVLRSIPRMAMIVGGFNRVEREAVPLFVDFVIKQVVGILLAFS